MSLRVTFPNPITFKVINEYGKRAVIEIQIVFWPVYHVARGPLKQDFLGIYLTTYFRVRNFGNAKAMRVIFPLKMFKI